MSASSTTTTAAAPLPAAAASATTAVAETAVGDVSHVVIEKTPAESAMHDVMGGSQRWTAKLGEHGSIALMDVMPRLAPEGQTADYAIVQAARVSYGAGTKQVNEDRGLIRYLLRHQHTTPFEMVEFKFRCEMPIFVARQWIRHRTANVNEYSARYSVVRDRFFHPTADAVRRQSRVNRQGGDDTIDNGTAEEFLAYLDRAEALYADYTALVDKGVSRELARIALPQSTFTEWVWKCDLHNIFRFLALRMDAHAQREIRDYADAMFALIRPIVPVAAEAFLDYQLGALTLTRLEVEALRSGAPLASENSRERSEWDEKRRALGL